MGSCCGQKHSWEQRVAPGSLSEADLQPGGGAVVFRDSWRAAPAGGGSQGLTLGSQRGLGGPGGQAGLPASAGGHIPAPIPGSWAEGERGGSPSAAPYLNTKLPSPFPHRAAPGLLSPAAPGTAPHYHPGFPPLNLPLLRPPLPKPPGQPPQTALGTPPNPPASACAPGPAQALCRQ